MCKKVREKCLQLKYWFINILNRPIGFLIYLSLLLILISSWSILSFSDKFSPFYESVFSVSATIIATIFTISLTFIGIQYFVQNIPYELLKYFFKSKFIISMFSIYVCSIIFNLIMLSLGMRNVLWLIVSISLSIVSIVYLLAYFYYLSGTLQEINILYLITKHLKKKSYAQDYEKYEALKDLIVKSIKENKHSLYKKSLNFLFRKEQLFLSLISKRKIQDNYTFDQRHSDVEKLTHFFMNFQKQIFYELLEHKRQLYLFHYIEFMKELQKTSFVLLSPRPYYELRDHFNKIGDKILEYRFDEVYLFYCHKLRDITQYEYDKVQKEKLVSYYDLDKSDKDETESQRTEKVLIHMMYESFESDRLRFLVELSRKAIQKEVDILNCFPKSILCNILDKALNLKKNEGMRWILIQNIMYLLKQIHEENIKKGKFDKFLWLNLHNIIKSLKNIDEIKRLGSSIARDYCLAQLNFVKTHPRETIRELGIEGRCLTNDDKYKIIIKLLMETFDRILIMLSKKEIKDLEKDYVSSEIHSIIGKSKENNKLIETIIKKHQLKPSKNVYMMGVYMGRKTDWEKRKNKK